MPNDVTFDRVPIESSEAQSLIAAMLSEFSQVYSPEELAPVFAAEGESDGDGFDGVFIIARRAGAAVGCGGVRRLAGGATGELKRIYVDPEHRGAGVARQLVTTLESEAAALRLSRLTLTTCPRLVPAIRLYESMGYTLIPNYDAFIGIAIIISYEKRLA